MDFKNMHNDQRARCHILRLHKNPVLYQLKKHLVFCHDKCTVDFMVVLGKKNIHHTTISLTFVNENSAFS